MAWLPEVFRTQLYGVSKEQYVFVECVVCHSCYRWGKLGFKEGFIRCPICGAYTSHPKLIDKVQYIQWLQRIRTPAALAELQKMVWNPQNVD